MARESPVQVRGVPSVSFSSQALADLDRMSSRHGLDALMELLEPDRESAVRSWHMRYTGACRTVFGRWSAVVDGIEVTFDVLTTEKVMIIALRRV